MMKSLKQYIDTINAVLAKKGYPLYEWEQLDGFNMQDESFIQAAIVVRDELLKLCE